MNLAAGYWTLARWRGIALRFHWSALILAWAIGGFGFLPAAWIGVLSVLLVHELGHAVLVLSFRGRVREIGISGLGGVCHWDGHASPFARSLIAWGGVLAQLVVLVVAKSVPHLLGDHLAYVWTRFNLIMMVINLLPLQTLDGFEAWKIFPILKRTIRRRRLTSRLRTLEAQLESVRSEPEDDSAQPWLN